MERDFQAQRDYANRLNYDYLLRLTTDDFDVPDSSQNWRHTKNHCYRSPLGVVARQKLKKNAITFQTEKGAQVKKCKQNHKGR